MNKDLDRWNKIITLIDSKTNIDDIPCSECGGEGFCEYARGEDVEVLACEACNKYGDEPDDDRGED